MSRFYHIIVQGHLDARWSAWFDVLAIINRENGEAVLAVAIRDQAELHAVLVKIRDLGLPLIAVQPVVTHEPADRDEDGEAARSA